MSIRLSRCLGAVALCLGLGFAQTAAAGMIGDNIDINYQESGFFGAGYSDSALGVLVTDNASPEFTNTLGNETYSVFVGAEDITIELTGNFGVWGISGGSLTWTFSDLDWVGTPASVVTGVVVQNVSGLDGVGISTTFTGNSVEVVICPECAETGDPLDGVAPFFASLTLFLETASLTISPPPGTYATTQQFDLTLIVDSTTLSVIGGTATLDGVDVSASLVGCLLPGTLLSGGETFRCPMQSFAAGTHVLSVTVDLSNGASISDSVTWEVVGNTEP